MSDSSTSPKGQLPNCAGADLIADSARQDLTNKIKVCIDKAERATARAEQFYITAGQHIKTVKGLWPDHWLEIVEQDCGIKRTRTYEILAIADGRTTVEETRAKTNERSRRHDERVKASVANGQNTTALPPTNPGSGSPGFDAAREWAKRLGREVKQLGSGGFALSMPDGHPGVCLHSLKSLNAALKEIETALEEHDRKTCIALAEKACSADPEFAQWLYSPGEARPIETDAAEASAAAMKAAHAAAEAKETTGSSTAGTPTETTSADAGDEITIEDAEAELKRLKDLKAKLKDNDEAQDKFDAQESMKVFAAFKAACSKLLPGMNSNHLQEAIDFFAEAVEVPANELMPDLSIIQFDLKIAKAEVTALKRKIAGKLPPRESRAAAWSRLTSEACAAIDQLIEYQSEFEEAGEAQPEGLRDGPFAQKCEAIREIDLASALETLQEAEGAEVPLGFGRD